MMEGKAKKRILLVDDSRTSLRQLEKVFMDLGKFEVIGKARNGAEAVKLYKTLNPDLVVMDIIMPSMDGLQALRSIMQLDKQAKVLMISSVGGVGDKAIDVFRLGAIGIISKPYDPQQIANTIESL